LAEIEVHKKVLKEPKDNTEFNNTIRDYYSQIFEGERKGAIMLGVCRARMSEGIDFSDDKARMVIVVGIPYPNLTDPKIILRRNYLERRFRR